MVNRIITKTGRSMVRTRDRVLMSDGSWYTLPELDDIVGMDDVILVTQPPEEEPREM